MNFTKLTLVLALGLMSNGLSYGQKSAVPKSQAVGVAAKQAPALKEIKLTAEQKRLRQFNTVELGAHNKVWERIEYKLDKHGKLTSHPHRYEELATGMHYRQAGKWFPTEEKIEILPNSAGAIAVKGPHKAIFPVELKSGIIELQTPDEHWMRSRVWGLAYYDTSTGESVLLAEVKESDGQVVGDNVVVYPDAFTDVVADVRYTYTRSGFEQDVVMRSQPPGPEKFGLNPKTTRLQVLTEFVESPRPSKSPRNKDGMTDETLGFGDMTIGSGKAFSVDAAGAQTGNVSVSKEWGVLENRNFLIEQVHFEKVSEQLKKLPAAKAYKGASLERRGKGESVLVGLKNLVPKRYVKSTAPPNKTRQMAKVTTSATPSFVMDYQVVTDQPNYTFKGDTTYSITGPVNLSGTTTIEGGAVMKYYTNATTLNILGTVDCKTEPYRPAVFTTFNDNTVGEVVPGQGSTPSTCSGSFTLHVVNDSDYQVSISIYDDANNYVAQDIAVLDWSSVDITFTAQNQKHYTFWAGDTQTGGNNWVFNGEFWPTLQNGLMYLDNNAGTFYTESGSSLCSPPTSSPTVALTLANGGALHDLRISSKDIGISSTENFSITNMQFLNCSVALKTITASFYAGNILMSDVTTAFDGDYYSGVVEHLTYDHGIWVTQGTGVNYLTLVNSLITAVLNYGVITPTIDHTIYLPYQQNGYQTVGAGAHYLPATSGLRNMGTTSINTGLAAELKNKTTYAPVLRSSYTISVNEIWIPTALRDTDTPDIGYHYDPIDYTVKNVTVQNNAQLSLSGGVCISSFGNANGIYVTSGSKTVSEGTPKTHNWIVRYNSVQEVADSTNNMTGAYSSIWVSSQPVSSVVAGSFRFTSWSRLAESSSWYSHFYSSGNGYGSLCFKDCQTYGGGFSIDNVSIGMTNCLFDSVKCSTYDEDEQHLGFFYNNLFRNGQFKHEFYYGGGQSFAYDNLFDHATITYAADREFTAHGKNAYTPGNTRLSPNQASDVTLTSSPVYSTGPLGKWYLNTTIPTLVNVGSRLASAAGLYHHTVKTGTTKEASTQVDIGFHYLALDANNNFLDTDGDGLADSIEDTNGSGGYDSGDAGDFVNVDSDGDGLPDNYELTTTLTSPTATSTGNTGVSDGYKDLDGDGLSNLEEMYLGKNPLVPNVASPNFSPVGGPYSDNPLEITITCPTVSADTVIRYTTDGSIPTKDSLTIANEGIISVSPAQSPLILSARAFRPGWVTSDVERQKFVVYDVTTTAALGFGQSLTITPSGGGFAASDTLEILCEAGGFDTGFKLQLYCGGVNGYKVAETTAGVLRYPVKNIPTGSYTYIAKVVDAEGFVYLTDPAVFTITAPGPVVSLVGTQPFFTSSPGTLLANITGVNPTALTSLTLNGVAIPKRTGEFVINAALVEGPNIFTLTANGTTSASTTVYLDSIKPVVAITSPAHNAILNTTRGNVSGTFTETSLKQITVNGVLAFINGSTFTALNVPLATGANPIVATAEDIAGNTKTATINITGGATLVDPVQLSADTVGGFAPLGVTFTPTISPSIPGTVQQVQYDVIGNNLNFQTANAYSYAAGEFFPVVTVTTTAGKFSSLGGWNSTTPDRLRINVQVAPVQVGSAINITDPVDLKVTADKHLYILSKSTATIYEYDETPASVRSVTIPGTTPAPAPNGLDVDANGNVYVAISALNQVARYKHASGTGNLELDTTFGTGGYIGSAGTGDGQFNTPYDVAVSPDGQEIVVSDSGNHRIQRFSTEGGAFLGKFGSSGNAVGQFNTPKGLTYDGSGYLYIVDSGNNRTVLATSTSVLGTSSSAGDANLGVGARGIYVADGANNRVLVFDPIKSRHGVSPTPFTTRLELSGQDTPVLNQPRAITAIPDFLEEKIYIADNYNGGRVLKVTLPETTTPVATWDAMKAALLTGNIDQAIPHFSSVIGEDYRAAFFSIGITKLNADIADITAAGALTPVFIKDDTAQYYFERTIDGKFLLFPVDFVKENGVWKISDF